MIPTLPNQKKDMKSNLTLKKWFFDFETLNYIRSDGAHISGEYLEDMRGKYKKITDKLLDALWELFKTNLTRRKI